MILFRELSHEMFLEMLHSMSGNPKLVVGVDVEEVASIFPRSSEVRLAEFSWKHCETGEIKGREILSCMENKQILSTCQSVFIWIKMSCNRQMADFSALASCLSEQMKPDKAVLFAVEEWPSSFRLDNIRVFMSIPTYDRKEAKICRDL